MKNLNQTITLKFNKDNKLTGNPLGKFIYAVISVDDDDFEDSSVTFYLANDEDDLLEVWLKDNGFADDDRDMIEEIWGYKLLPKKIATLK
jgi:hypothetical protein